MRIGREQRFTAPSPADTSTTQLIPVVAPVPLFATLNGEELSELSPCTGDEMVLVNTAEVRRRLQDGIY